MADEQQPTVRVSPASAAVLATATAAAGALNTALATFHLGNPFGRGKLAGDVTAELTRVGNAGVSALRAVEVALSLEDEIDLDLVAESALETVGDALWLVVRSLEGVLRLGVGPSAERQVESLREAVEALAELLPGERGGEDAS